MLVSDFKFDLPDELIARYPTKQRTASRLLHLEGNTGAICHKKFVDLLGYVRPGDLLVFNDTRVIPARLFGHKETGGKVELLVERIVARNEILAHVRASKSPKQGSVIVLEDSSGLTMLGRSDDLFHLKLSG